MESPTKQTSWEYLTLDVPTADHDTNPEVWVKGLNDLGAEGWEAVGTISFSKTVNYGLGPTKVTADKLLLKRPQTNPGE